MEPGDELYDAKVKVLGEYIKHHVKEEQNELFPEVRKSDMDLAEIGAKLEARKSGADAAAMTDAGRERGPSARAAPIGGVFE